MIDRIEILAARIRHLISRNRWSARLLGYPAPLGGGHEAGLVLIQIDGLGEDVLRRALAEGRMPFLKHLLDDEGYDLHSLYTGMPSSTPGFQAELFYGETAFVPAFGYRDRELGRVLSMNDPAAASAVERRLLERARGLMHGGSAWANIFSGDASEPHLCASTAGLDLLFQALNPLRMLGLTLWYGWSVVRVIANLFAETGLAFYDFVRGTRQGMKLVEELRFIPTRVMVSAVMREIVTAGAAIDANRGLPIIQLNLLGYDEHAHRRGPDSRFARWTLKGIDNSVRRVWLGAHRSKRRDYQVWIYSDHGQEASIAYPLRYGESVTEAVGRVTRRFEATEARIFRQWQRSRLSLSSGVERSDWLRRDLPEWMRRRRGDDGDDGRGRSDGSDRDDGMDREDRPTPVPPTDDEAAAEPTIVHQGPVGFVYPSREMEPRERDRLAELIALDAHIPMVLTPEPDHEAHVFTKDGRRLTLPADAAEVFGAKHPFLEEVTVDTLDVVHHPDSGPLVLLGWMPGEPHSLQLEHGSHGGPGSRETAAFVMLPAEATPGSRPAGTLRPARLREMALRVLEGVVAPTETSRVRVAEQEHAHRTEELRTHLRLLCYNVHGCRGMDGKYSPQRIARVISRLEPDIICLQELDHRRSRSGGVNQVEAIAKSLAADYHFHAVAEIDDGHFGNAILSHLPLRDVAAGPLPALRSVPGLEDRGVLWVAADIDGCELNILNTHLSILEQERRLQADRLLDRQWLGRLELRGPAVLCGDLNAGPESYTCRRIGEVLTSVDHAWSEAADPPVDGVLNTWSSRIPLRRIDHVFVSEDVVVDAIRVPRTRLTRVASDHLPLVVDLSCGAGAAVERPPLASAASSAPPGSSP